LAANGLQCERIGEPPGTEADQLWLFEVVLTAAGKDRVADVLAWCLHDYPIKNPNAAYFGLVRANGTLQPAVAILRDAYSRWICR